MISYRFFSNGLIPTFFIIFFTSTAEAQLSWQRLTEAEILRDAQPTVEWSKYNDEDTGYEVWQMTSAEGGTWATHFNTQSITPDDRYLVFSSNRSGSWQLYRASLENGEIYPITRVQSLSSSNFTIHPDGKEVFFSFDGKIGRVHLVTGEILFAEFNEPVMFRRMISNNGLYSVVTHSAENQSALYLIELNGLEILASLHWPTGITPDNPLRAAGSSSPRLQWTGGISHTLMNPEYPWLITFLPTTTHREETGYFDQQRDMTLPKELRARAWIWDARTGEARPFVSAPYHYSYTHESWCRTGERFFLFQKSVPDWVPNHISSVNKKGDDWRYHHSDDTLRLGHGSASNDGKWFISDGQDPERNPLRLIHLKTGQWEDICWPDATISRGHSLQAHVHPSFSPSGNYVAFTSDRTGTSQAYVIRIPEEIKKKLSDPATR